MHQVVILAMPRRFCYLVSLFVFFGLFDSFNLANAQSLADFNVVPVQLGAPRTEAAGKTAHIHYAPDAVSHPYNGILVSGQTSIPEPKGWVRFDSDPDGAWKPLTFLKSSRTAPFIAGYRGEIFRDGEEFTLRFERAEGEELVILEAGVFDNRQDDDRAAGEKRGADAVAPPSHPASMVPPPALINRAEWNADPFIRGTPVPLAQPRYSRMTFHHAACCSAYSYEEGLRQVKAIQDFHQDVRGWSDIGYHFVLDQEGRLYQGRPFLDQSPTLDAAPVLAQGAHVGGFNVGNIGVAVLGCYHPPEGNGCTDRLSDAARDSLVAVYAYLSENYGVNTSALLGHRDQGSTACPGDHNYAMLPQLREDIDFFRLSARLPSDRPTSYLLEQAFPNPVTQSATIRYFVNLEGFVRIELFNAAGERLNTLVDSFQEGEQWYTVDFPSAGIASGTYFYRMTVDGFSGTVYDETRTLQIVR